MTPRPWRRWALAVAVAGSAILFLAPVTNPVPTVEGVETDKVAHALVVGALAALIWWNLRAGRWRTSSAVLLASGYAAAIEVAQGFLTFRSGEVMDLIAGMMGAVIVVAAIAARTRRRTGPPADRTRAAP